MGRCSENTSKYKKKTSHLSMEIHVKVWKYTSKYGEKTPLEYTQTHLRVWKLTFKYEKQLRE